MTQSIGPQGVANPSRTSSPEATSTGVTTAHDRQVLHDAVRRRLAAVDAKNAPQKTNAPAIIRTHRATVRAGVDNDHAASLLNAYESVIDVPAARRHCVQGLRDVLPLLGLQERKQVLRHMQAINGKHWRSVLYFSHEKANNALESLLGTMAMPLSQLRDHIDRFWAVDGMGLAACKEYLFGAQNNWTHQVVRGLTHGFAHVPDVTGDWRQPIVQTLVQGFVAGLVIKRGVDHVTPLALDAGVRQILFAPRLDSKGVDRTPEVTEVVFQLLSMVTNPGVKKGFIKLMTGLMAMDKALSRAFADFAGSPDPAVRNAALDVIGSDPDLENALSEGGPVHLHEGWGLFHLNERCQQTELAMNELRHNRLVRPSLNDPQIRADVTQRLGGHAPLLWNEGWLFYETSRQLTDFNKTISPPNVLRACLQEIAAMPVQVDRLLSELRDQQFVEH